jgi:hypothetical protein
MGGTGVFLGIYTGIPKYSKRSAIIYGWIHIPNNIVRIGRWWGLKIRRGRVGPGFIYLLQGTSVTIVIMVISAALA